MYKIFPVLFILVLILAFGIGCTVEEKTTYYGVALKDQDDDDADDDIGDDDADDDDADDDDDTADDDDDNDDNDDDAGETEVVEIFDEEPVTKEEKTITSNVDMPAGSWFRIVYHFYILAGTDVWDRLVVTSLDMGGDVPLEIDRGITDWGYDLEYERDMTDYSVVLEANKDISTYVSTYTEGIGWYVTSELVYETEGRNGPPTQIIPITFKEVMQVWPEEEIDTSSITREVTFPSGMSGLTFSIFATGHSPTGSGAEEFGPLRTIRVFIDEDEIGDIQPWRNDCHTTGSHGTTWPRSGWCPRDMVEEHEIGVTNPGDYTGTHDVTIAFDLVTRYWYVSLAAKVWE